jgi:hypothetical protein
MANFLEASKIKSKIINGRHKQRSGRHTLARQKNIQKKNGEHDYCKKSGYKNILKVNSLCTAKKV